MIIYYYDDYDYFNFAFFDKSCIIVVTNLELNYIFREYLWLFFGSLINCVQHERWSDRSLCKGEEKIKGKKIRFEIINQKQKQKQKQKNNNKFKRKEKIK